MEAEIADAPEGGAGADIETQRTAKVFPFLLETIAHGPGGEQF